MSEYSGHVEPGGPYEERSDGPLVVRKLSVGPWDNSCYVIADQGSGNAFLVDAANEPDRLREAASGFELVAVVQTHGHFDHVQAWSDMKADPGAPIWGHADDRHMFPAEPDRLIDDGDVLSLGEVTLRVIHTPGHTPGSIQFLIAGGAHPHLFSGDSLFPGGPGKTNSDADFDQIMDGLEGRIFATLPDPTWVYPGHGDDTTLGIERPHLAEWRARRW